jgi:hypothetical protein
MTEIKDCLPTVEAKRHFTDLRNIRLEAETATFQAKLRESRAQMAARGIGRSGAQELQAWQFKEGMFDALLVGFMQDAIDTCKKYEIPLTRPLCECLLRAAEDQVVAQYRNALQTHAQGVSDVKIPLHIRSQRAGNLTGNSFPVMKKVRVLVENARIADGKERLAMTAPKEKSGDNYHQTINQSGGVMNASQTGNVSMQQGVTGDMASLMPALSEMRAFFKAQNSLDADESVGLLAGAEKAMAQKDESKALKLLKQVPKGAWELGKTVIPPLLLAFLKAHGILPS